MRELELLAQYLVQLRQEKLQHSHLALLGAVEDWGDRARIYANQAEFCDRIRDAVAVLKEDPGQFIEKFLKRGEK